jgi:hypothetical protein
MNTVKKKIGSEIYNDTGWSNVKEMIGSVKNFYPESWW